VLVYRCPTTHRQVKSEIETTAQALARLRTLKLSLWCPHCGSGHIVCASVFPCCTLLSRGRNPLHPTQLIRDQLLCVEELVGLRE
jgi:hypothetical protein